jgi:ectoine hydroxylase-related dioxygenase (phytanoyl-CoA dioxygenase family)
VTSSKPAIAANQHDFFRREGYLYVPDLVSREHCAGVLDEFAETVPGARKAAASRSFWRTDAAHTRLESAARILGSDAVLALLKTILGPNVALLSNRHGHITLNAGMGKAGRLHRDILHWSRNLVSVILYVNVPAGLELGNGTAVLPGSHLLPTAGRINNGGTWLDEGPHAALAQQTVNLRAEVGAALLMDGMTYHRAQTRLPHDASDPPAARVAITWACRAVDELHSDDISGPIQLLTGDDLYRGNDRRAPEHALTR